MKNKSLGVIYKVAMTSGVLLMLLGLMVIIPYAAKVYKAFPSYVIFLGLFLLGIIIYFISDWFLRNKIMGINGYNKYKLSFSIDSDKVTILMDDSFKSELTRKDIKNFVDYKNYLFIFYRKCSAYYIPPSAFVDKHVRQQFKDKIELLIMSL